MAKKANFQERLITPTSRAGLDPEIAGSFNWGRGSRRTGATDFYGVPDMTVRSGVTIRGIEETRRKFAELGIASTKLRPTNLRAAVKLENAAFTQAPVARGPSAYWTRPKSNPKPPAGGLRRSIRSFATDDFGQVDAGGGRGAQVVGGYTRSQTGEFARGVGSRGQRTRTVGGKSFTTAKGASAERLGSSGSRIAQYGAGKGNVPYAGAIHFGWNTRPNAQKKWLGGPIKPNPFLWRAYQAKQGEILRVYVIDFKKMVKEVGL